MKKMKGKLTKKQKLALKYDYWQDVEEIAQKEGNVQLMKKAQMAKKQFAKHHPSVKGMKHML